MTSSGGRASKESWELGVVLICAVVVEILQVDSSVREGWRFWKQDWTGLLDWTGTGARLGGPASQKGPRRFTQGSEEADAEQRRSRVEKRAGGGLSLGWLFGAGAGGRAGNFLWVSEV
jgi:hypothetical protein